ncbi:hypothetical protein CesoFtcFv8_010736 [Champsocephalus esox]|uniref:THAP-type domain-containing protein n=1 Tax=Champsocephalus esox TaxID=159716 RepID=A0AAN8BYL6_9TELE|nr:hypothetical protein CesoFtcFv8_010736 [Champsocephalus esox]
MPEHCAAYCCANRRTIATRGRGITFHKFPKDKDMRKKWEVALRREGFTASESSVICTSRFTSKDWKRAGLRLLPEKLKRACLWPLRTTHKLQPHTHNLSLMMIIATSCLLLLLLRPESMKL